MKGGVAQRARILREDVVFDQRFDLCNCGLQERFIGGARWEGVRVLGIILQRIASERRGMFRTERQELKEDTQHT